MQRRPAHLTRVSRKFGDPVLNDDESATENLELWATYFDVPPAPGVFRIDLPYPGNCTF